jgi:hypothetical protein
MAKSCYPGLNKTEMKLTALRRAIVCLSSAMALLAASTASAQYIWLNEKGVKQYSDMPPPASVPDSRILKQPGGRAVSLETPDKLVASEQSSNEDKSANPEKAKLPLSTAEKNAEFQKRRMEQAEKEKKAAEQQQQAGEKAKTCERAQAYQRSLESGERLARTDKNGERYYLNEQQRAQEMQENRRLLDTCR